MNTLDAMNMAKMCADLNVMTKTLEMIAKDKDEGNAEGYYGTLAYNTLKGLGYITENENGN